MSGTHGLRGQSVVEFFITYGSAVLITVLLIGAASYFGVLNPEKLLPERCELQQPFICYDWIVTPSEAAITVSAITQEPLQIERVSFKSHATGEECLSLIPVTLSPGKTIRLNTSYYCKIYGKGSKIRMDVRITYRKLGGTSEKSAQGTLISRIE